MFILTKRHFYITGFFIVFLYTFLSIFSSVATFKVSSEESLLDPASFNIGFEEIEIISDENTVSSWWIPGSTDKTILVLHGLRSQKSDPLILKFIEEFHLLGFSIIAIDFRNHGKSSKGEFTFGLDEVNDVYIALDYYYAFKNIKSVGIWGFSYGATAGIFSGLEYDSNKENTEIVAIFSDTPYFSLTDLISAQIARRTPLNLFMASLLKPGILIFTELFYGFDFNSIEQNYRAYSEIDIPTKVIGCTGDSTVPLDQPTRANKSLGKKSILVEFEKCEAHGDAYGSDPLRYLDEFEKHFTDLF